MAFENPGLLFSNNSWVPDILTDESSNSNTSGSESGAGLNLPLEYTTISPTSLRTIFFYTILLFLGVTGNLSVLISFYRHRLALKWRITILIIHLSLADLLVITVVIPSEIIWRATIQWYGGDFVCKVVQFGRAFGLYASSMIIVVISVDRLYAIVYPLRMVRGGRRVKAMLAAAWLCAAVAAAPQSLIFSVQRHPKYTTFQQCVTYHFLTTEKDEMIYSLFSVFGMYFIPLAVIVFSYSMILWKIVRKSREHRQQVASVRRQLLLRLRAGPASDGEASATATNSQAQDGQDFGSTKVILLRRNTTTLAAMERNANAYSNASTSSPRFSQGHAHAAHIHHSHHSHGPSPAVTNASTAAGTCTLCGNAMSSNNTNDAAVQMMARAKWKILRLTFIIVLVFVVSWTPYVVMVLWYMFDRQSAKQLNTGLQDGLFMMAVANSCVNPFVYGNYTRGNRTGGGSGHDRNSNGNPKLCLPQERSMLACCGWKGPRAGVAATTTMSDRKKGSVSVSSHRLRHGMTNPRRAGDGGGGGRRPVRCTCDPNTTNNTNCTSNATSQKSHQALQSHRESVVVVMDSFPVTSVI